MALEFMLLAAQAAGIGLNLYESRRARRMENIGYDLDRDALRLNNAQLDLRMQQEGILAAEDSEASIRELREVLSSQRALFAARGQMGGAGSAKSIEQASIGAFNEDAKAKKLSLDFRKNYLKSQKGIIESTVRANRIGQLGVRAQRGNQLMMQGVNMFSVNSLFNDDNLFNSDAFALSGKLNNKGNSYGYNPNTKMTDAQRKRTLNRL